MTAEQKRGGETAGPTTRRGIRGKRLGIGFEPGRSDFAQRMCRLDADQPRGAVGGGELAKPVGRLLVAEDAQRLDRQHQGARRRGG